MRKHLAIIAAASMTVGGLVWTGSARAEDDRTTGQKMNDAADRAGDKMNDAADRASDTAQRVVSPDAKEIRRDLGKITDAALSRDAVDKLDNWFAKADRDRLGKAGDKKYGDLQDTVTAFRNDWKTKYSQDFNFKNDEVALANYQILQGDMGETARPAGERTTPSGMDMNKPDTNRPDSNQPGQPGAAVSGNIGDTAKTGDAAGQPAHTDRGDRADSKKMSTVIIPADPQHNLPQVTLHLVNEGTIMDAWRLDIPDTVDAQKVATSLKDHLYMLGQQKDNWPSDQNQAYSLAAHHIFAALTDTQMSNTGQPDSTKQPDMNQPGQPGGQTNQPGVQTNQPGGQTNQPSDAGAPPSR